MKQDGYTHDELHQLGPLPPYTGRQLSQIAFPLGGIGTGSVSLSGTGALVDWEIFNRPNFGSMMPGTFFTLWAQAEGQPSVCKVMQGPPQGPFSGAGSVQFGGFGFGVTRDTGAGLPHFRQVAFYGEYPLARVELSDPDVPLQVTLEAYNPFIPLNADDSSLPVAIFHVTLRNLSDKPVRVALAANLYNAVGYAGEGPFNAPSVGGSVNAYRDGDGMRGLFMSSERYSSNDPKFGSLALATTWERVEHQTCWFRGSWFDPLQRFWDEFSATGTLSERIYDEPSPWGRGDIGSLVLQADMAPGDTVTLPLFITWYFPNFIKYWGQAAVGLDGQEMRPVWPNYYAMLFADAWLVAAYVAQHAARLDAHTRLFHDALFSSTLPPYVLDALSSQMSILKTGTCLRLPAGPRTPPGTFYGFEGCHSAAGCCEGSCTHVWNYAQTLAFLFPALERSMRTADYTYNLGDDGHMGFRIQLPLGTPPWDFHAAADGQMGGVLKVYRDWKLCGDDEWLRSLWEPVKKSLAYAWKAWDLDRDGVMEGVQHNTYDIEFWGPNTLMGSFYLGALRAAEEMAQHLGEVAQADEYRTLYEQGWAKMDAELFNGEFYVQKINPEAYKTSPLALDKSMGGQIPGAPKYQYGAGCLSDQLLGQWLATLCGLGYVFEREHVRQALQSIFKYNWRRDFWNHPNAQRIYALNDEQGLLLCTWPCGGRPELPFPYSDEVWPGFEYQVASHLIYEGFVEEGLSIVRGVRRRFDGDKRNPWNEFECGSHYARSMSSWGLLTALSGFEFDAGREYIGFSPRLNPQHFCCFWSLGGGWGRFEQTFDGQRWAVRLSVEYGELVVKSLRLGAVNLLPAPRVLLDGAAVAATWDGTCLILADAATIRAGQSLMVEA